MLTSLLLADTHVAYDQGKHKPILEHIGEALPRWTDDIADWPKKKTTGMDIQAYFEAF